MSAQLRLLPLPAERPVPAPVPDSGVIVRREWSCGCVTRGVWVDTWRPHLRWFLSRGLVRACETRVNGKSCAAVRGEES